MAITRLTNGRAKGARGRPASARSVTQHDEEVGNRIRLKRIDAGLSQADLGETLNVSFQQIQKYEKGKNRLSGYRILEVCRVLKCSPHYLLGWEGRDTINGEMPAGVIKMAIRFAALDKKWQQKLDGLIDVFEG